MGSQATCHLGTGAAWLVSPPQPPHRVCGPPKERLCPYNSPPFWVGRPDFVSRRHCFPLSIFFLGSGFFLICVKFNFLSRFGFWFCWQVRILFLRSGIQGSACFWSKFRFSFNWVEHRYYWRWGWLYLAFEVFSGRFLWVIFYCWLLVQFLVGISLSRL